MKRWPLHKAYFWERFPFFRLLLPLVLGTYLYPQQWASDQNFIYTLSFCAVITAISYYICAIKKHSRQVYNTGSFIALHTSIIFLSWLLCYFSDIQNNPNWFGQHTTTAESYTIQLSKPPVEKEKTWKLEVDILNCITTGDTSVCQGRAYIYVYKYSAPSMKIGDVYTIPNKWKQITNRGNPFEFDYATYSAGNNIHYNAFVSGDEMQLVSYGSTNSIPFYQKVHYRCIEQLQYYISDKPTLGLLKAILIGDKDTLDTVLKDAYADTGIVHVIAISGAHIGIFFLLVLLLLKPVKHKKYYWLKYLAALPFIWLYVLIAGAPASAVRAATMFSLLAIGFSLQKQPNGINQLLATAFFLLCVNPMWLYSIGFQLSFVAVLSIFIFYQPLFKLYTPSSKILKTLWATITVSIAAEILVAPIVIYYFHLFPLQFIIANVLAYLFMGIILILGMLLIAVSPIYWLANTIGVVVTFLVSYFNKLIIILRGFNFDSFQRLTLTTSQLIIIYILILGIALYRIKKKQASLWISMSALCILLILFNVTYWQTSRQQVFVIYNSGNDNYIELITGRNATVIQSPKQYDPDIDKYVTKPAHINWHISKIDTASNQQNIYTINGEQVFVLSQYMPDTSIAMDYVVLNYKAKEEDIAVIKNTFEPKLLILGTNISRSKASKLVKAAEEIGLAVHDVRNNGAFIIRN